MAAHQWGFAPRFRRNAFGWKSDLPIKRIKEAVTEIKAVARKDTVLAAEGAVLFLTKVSAAIENVDGSSGSMGTAVNRAIEALVPIIAAASVSDSMRQRWLERLWEAIEDDGCCYIESLSDYWGDLCGEPRVALHWIELFGPTTERIWREWSPGRFVHYRGTNACLSAMIKAGQLEEVLALLELAPNKFWHDHRWGVRALIALGRGAEAIRYAESLRGINEPGGEISRVCEDILLRAGLYDEAYRRYALAANRGTTHLATHRAIAKKYPGKAPVDILRDLIASTPGEDGKWFAAAKEAGCFDLAIELVGRSYTDPRTLVRAARDFVQSQPQFALDCGLAALRWLGEGYGFDVTVLDVRDAYAATMAASRTAGKPDEETEDRIRRIVEGPTPARRFMIDALCLPQSPISGRRT